MNNQTFDPTEAAKAQDSYCTQHEVPMFAPSDGICYHCGRNIYDPITYRGREDHTDILPGVGTKGYDGAGVVTRSEREVAKGIEVHHVGGGHHRVRLHRAHRRGQFPHQGIRPARHDQLVYL